MIEIILLLIGARVVRRKWWVVALAGSAWMALGAFFFVDSFFDSRIPNTYFALPLLLDAVVSLIAAFQTVRTERSLRLGKAVLLVAIVLVAIDSPWHEDMIVGFLVGTFLIVNASWHAVSAYVVRFARWRLSMAGAAFEFLMGLWSFLPFPTYGDWAGEVGGDIGMLIMMTAAGLLSLAFRLRRLPPAMPMSTIMIRGWPTELDEDAAAAEPSKREAGAVTVHIWTPTGALVPVGVRRYLKAVNESGSVSAGHAALEVPPDIYISHYPAVEISRAPADFAKALRATPDNDIPGVFQPSYAEESAEWCPSTMQVRLDGLDLRAIRAFWRAYRRDTTYNLTNRNCTSVVAQALDAGIEGLFEHRAASPYFLWRLFLKPELWVAGVLRRRAAAMAWTPGIMLDYARALSYIVRLRQTLAADRRERAHAAR